ncbi:MAG: S8 family serine peptidase [Armatimonas sp.]
MKHRVFWAITLASAGVLAGLIGGCGGGGGNPAATPTPTPMATVPPAPGPRSVLLYLNPGADRLAIEREQGVTLEDGGNGLWRVRLRDDQNEDEVTNRLSQDSRISDAEENLALSSPEVHGSPIHQAFDVNLNALGQRDVNFENQAAWNQVDLAAAQTITRGAGVTVAVLDTGVAAQHPDLSGKLLPGYNALNPGATPDDASDGTLNNVVGHGTMVSGVIAQIAPEARILPVRVLNGDGVRQRSSCFFRGCSGQ